MSSLDLQIVVIIMVCYGVIASIWLIMAIANIKWATPYSFAGIGYVIVFIWYAYRNYDFFFNKMLTIDQFGLMANLWGVVLLATCTVMMGIPYLKIVWRKIWK